MDYYGWRPYVSVAQRRRQAASEIAKLKKKGRLVSPVAVEGRTIVNTFWGKAWCENLERYSDFANRLPRGRTYVRNGSVIDLQIAPGEIKALVSGSEIYKVAVKVAPVAKVRWQSICKDCAGAIDSLIELLQGRFSKGVMERVCRQKTGLFPSPEEIKLSCSCPDWADMCKHVAAALYGVGARLDEKPQLLFVLRGVDENELLANAGQDLALASAASGAARLLDDSDVAALFGLEMAESATSDAVIPTAPKRHQRSGTSSGRKTPALKKASSAKKTKPPHAALTKSGRKKTIPADAGKKGARSQPQRGP